MSWVEPPDRGRRRRRCPVPPAGPGRASPASAALPAPVAAADGLQVADFHRGPKAPGHGEHLREGFHHAVPLLPHVDSDGNAGIPQGFQRPDEAGSIIEALRRISQPQGDTQRTVPQCPLQQGVELTVFRLRQRVRPGTRPHRPGGSPSPPASRCGGRAGVGGPGAG